jgi:NitT/TauT family transport system permease protein
VILGVLLRILATAAAIVLWWWSTDVLSAENPILASMSPIDAVTALINVFANGSIWQTIGVSLERLGYGLGIAAVIGIALGLAIGSRRRVEQSTSIVVQFLRMVSPLSWAPVAVVLFGIGTPPVVFLIAIAAVWPITMSTAAGVKALDPNWVLLAKSMGATKAETLRSIVVPGIRAHVLTGVRLALGVAWIVLVPAEMLGVDSGLGYQILNARDQLSYDLLAGIMLLIGLIGFAMDWLAQALFKRWSAATA